MKVVLTYAHPCAESFVAAVRDRAIDGLRAAGHEVELIDLYAAAYDPSLPLPSADRDALVGAESLVLVHPTWWTAHPAILLAWIAQAAQTGLASVGSLVTLTTLGGSRLANRLAGESGARVITRAVRPHCTGRPVDRRMALYGLDRSTPEDRADFLGEVERRIATLVQR